MHPRDYQPEKGASYRKIGIEEKESFGYKKSSITEHECRERRVRMKNLTAIYWIKNEGPYLAEYIEFHLLQGFDYFIFYDNGSTDNTMDVLEPYIKENLVEVRTYPTDLQDSKNYWLMTRCIDEQKNKSQWVHFHAIDERIYCPDGRKIPELLRDYEEYGGLCVAWREFNSNGHIKKPEGLIIENYTAFFNDSKQHIKTIIQPLKTQGRRPPNPHCFYYDKNFAVDENKKRVDGSFNLRNPYTFELIKNHHYRTMSREEFEDKSNKGILDQAHQENIPRGSQDTLERAWNKYSKTAGQDVSMEKFVVPVRNAVKKRYSNNLDLLKTINH